MFIVSHNQLTGTLNPCIYHMTNLTRFAVDDNNLHGSISGLFNPEKLEMLYLVAMGQNSFTGTIPSELFLLPQIKLLGLSMNCLHGELPSTVCKAQTLEALVLDGIHSSSNCVIHEAWNPFDTVHSYLGAGLHGTVPDCVWKLPKLVSLHFAGNGLKGTIPSLQNASEYGPLFDLSLTHNMFSGYIPTAFEQKPFIYADFSYNKFKGSLFGFKDQRFSDHKDGVGMHLSATANRLSGRLPDSFEHAYNLSVLSGNLFACERLPQNDPAYSNYVCGSSEKDNASYVFAGVLCFAFMIVFVVYCGYKVDYQWHYHAMQIIKLFRDTLIYCRHCEKVFSMPSSDGKDVYENLLRYIASLTIIRMIAIAVMLYTIFILGTVFIVLYNVNDGEYTTHINYYTWVSTSVFLTGDLSAALLFSLWTIHTIADYTDIYHRFLSTG